MAPLEGKYELVPGVGELSGVEVDKCVIASLKVERMVSTSKNNKPSQGTRSRPRQYFCGIIEDFYLS